METDPPEETAELKARRDLFRRIAKGVAQRTKSEEVGIDADEIEQHLWVELVHQIANGQYRGDGEATWAWTVATRYVWAVRRRYCEPLDEEADWPAPASDEFARFLARLTLERIRAARSGFSLEWQIVFDSLLEDTSDERIIAMIENATGKRRTLTNLHVIRWRLRSHLRSLRADNP